MGWIKPVATRFLWSDALQYHIFLIYKVITNVQPPSVMSNVHFRQLPSKLADLLKRSSSRPDWLNESTQYNVLFRQEQGVWPYEFVIIFHRGRFLLIFFFLLMAQDGIQQIIIYILTVKVNKFLVCGWKYILFLCGHYLWFEDQGFRPLQHLNTISSYCIVYFSAQCNKLYILFGVKSCCMDVQNINL